MGVCVCVCVCVCVTYKSEGSQQDPHGGLDGGHPLQLLGGHLAIPSDVTGTHGDYTQEHDVVLHTVTTHRNVL